MTEHGKSLKEGIKTVSRLLRVQTGGFFVCNDLAYKENEGV
ncbi:hypothetical protein [Heyndrickxia acidicola]|uniref:Uncharacterized protein n=1 Tax=Heyndrickxia acidicola TaxID=209389 RepID=A0ABU6MM62_9BACI|nr:hypothetical protein [Heyndrickxia acidicola]MED1204150.1 hypothetical protein [Heyndrickxia acidicola]